MPPLLLIDLHTIDFNNIIYDTKAIEEINPHRFEMRQLDAVVHLDLNAGEIVGYRDTCENDFWVRGHIPGRPLMPGVLMIEAAAQLASIGFSKSNPDEKRFLGFSGIENVKFRGQVLPGQRLCLLGKFLESRPRRFKVAAQGVVDGELVFHATIIGMPI